MSKNTVIHKVLAISLIFCLVVPGVAFAGGKSGKKNYKEGLKYEQLQQWDMAAQQYALAVAAEPNNPEFKLHYLRALQQASIMYVKRGDALADQGDFASAYTAYRTAYNYDQGNELSRMKMERMLEQQKAQQNGTDPGNINKVANVKPTSNEIQMATKPRSKDVVQAINFKEAKFKTVVLNLGRQLGLNVVFDESVKDQPISIDLTDVTVAKALDIIFRTYKFTFEQVDRRTILVYAENPTNRQRFENLLVKTFYLGNITANQARTALQAMLPPGRQFASLDQPNAAGGNLLVVKATASELQLVQDILDSLDKNKNEVVVDVEIYEISHDSALEIGNQVVTSSLGVTSYDKDINGNPITYTSGNSSSLSDIGGIGRSNINPIAGITALPNFGLGTLIGLPPTQLKALQSRGDTKLLYRTQVHALDGQKNTTKVGKSVPVKLGTSYGAGGYGGGLTTGSGAGGVGGAVNGAINGAFGGGYGGYPIDSIQYRDVGLVIEAKPAITTEGYVELEMKFETSDVLASGASSNLTPTFTQRTLQTTARIQDGVTSVVAGINQEVKGDSRAGIPFISMIPILGRFVSAPRQTNTQSDIIITVTPHIMRSQGINKEDYLAKFAGQQAAGPAPNVEEVVNRAQQEDEQERRLIAQQMPQTSPLNTPMPGTTQAANVNPTPQRIQPVGNNTNNGQRTQKVVNNQSLQNVASGTNSAPPGSSPSYTIPPQIQQQPVNTNTQAEISAVSNNASPNAPIASQPGQAGGQAGGQANVQPAGQGTQGNDPANEAEDVFAANMRRPDGPVPQAEVVMVTPPEHVQKALQKMREDKLREENRQRAALEAKAKSPAASGATSNGKAIRGGSSFTFSLSPQPVRLQPGKSFTVAVEVNGQSQMIGANIALKFDEKKLKVKTVKGAGILGAEPDLSYTIEKGSLLVEIKQKQSAPVQAIGRVIVVEFAAIAEGQSEIAFNNSGTQVKMPGNLTAQVTGNSTQVIVSRDSINAGSNDR